MNPYQTEERNMNLNKTTTGTNVIIKKIKIAKKNNTNTPNILSHSQSQQNFYNLYKNKKIIKSDKTKSVDLINSQNNNNNIRTKLFKFRNKNEILENNKTNINYNIFKSANNNNNLGGNSNLNINESVEHKLLYEDIIKLKTRINKLKMEYSFIKSLTRKKDEEIRELERYKEEAKYYYGKNDKNNFFEKLRYLKQIVDLKNIYEDIKIKLRQQKDINNAIFNQIKFLDLAELKNKNEENLKKLKRKVEEYNEIQKINEDLVNEISKTDWVKNKFLENHKFVIKLKLDYDQKKSLINSLQEKLDKLVKQRENINTKKNRILLRNSSIKNDNEKLLKERKAREDYLIKQIEIEKKIASYETMTMNLKNETSENEENINRFTKNKIIEPVFKYKSFYEENPFHNKEKKVTLYESLINDSKKRQNEIKEKIKELMEENEIKFNSNKRYNKIIIKNDKKEINTTTDKNNINEVSEIFENNTNNINTGIKDIKLEEKEKDGNLIENNNNDNDNNNNELILLLNIMFYINDISEDKIKNILLNFKTEKYFINSLNEKNSSIMKLSTEILQTFNNKKDIDNLKNVLLYLLEKKYKENLILFSNEAINDIFILKDNNKILFNKKEEKNLLEKIKKIFWSKNTELLISKLNKIKNNIISYENLISLLNEEKFFISKEKNNEEMKYFQFFIYIIKEKENLLSENYSLKEFDKNNILELINDLKQKPQENNDFISTLINFLEKKNITLENLLGKNDYININEFMNILRENEFKVENGNFDLFNALQKYQKDENSGNIDINYLKNDLEKYR